MNTRQFCNSNKISIDSEMVDENPNMVRDNWQAYHYKDRLTFGKRQLTTFFSMGLAHTNEPDAEDVLDCLASDAAGIENTRNLEEWCGEYGYDADSRKAEKTYKLCQKQAKDLKRFLGEEAYKTLLWETERL